MYLGNTPQYTTRIDFNYTATAGQTVFTGTDSVGLTLSYDPNNYDVFVNGALLTKGQYTGTDGSTITLNTASTAGDLIIIRNYGIPASLNALLPAKFDVTSVGYLGAYRNKIINGDFDIWQRATSQTNSGMSSVDRWYCNHNGSTKTHSQVEFTLGQTAVPGNPKYHSRTAVTSVAGAANYVFMHQRIENVRILSGKLVTLTFYAKADANKVMFAELYQSFGTGGTPSGSVVGLGSLVSLTTSWQRFDIVATYPSVAGKTLGTNGDDFSAVLFWLDAGSDYSVRLPGMVQQSGTFDIAHVSIVEGDARNETDPFSPRHYGQELALCQRYYEAGEYRFASAAVDSGGATSTRIRFNVTKYSVPTISKTDTTLTNAAATGTANITAEGFDIASNGLATGAGMLVKGTFTADAEF